MSLKYKFIVWGILFSGAVALVVALEQVPPGVRNFLLKEDAIIEALSAIAYFAAAALLFLQAVMRLPARWGLFLIVLCFGMRELDFDKRFTTMGIFKSRFYLSGSVPALEKLLGVLVVAALLASVYFLIKNHYRSFREGIRRGDGIATGVLFSGGALVVAKSLDGIARRLKPFGIETSELVKRLASSIEEVLELVAALLILIIAAVAFRRPQTDAVDSD